MDPISAVVVIVGVGLSIASHFAVALLIAHHIAGVRVC